MLLILEVFLVVLLSAAPINLDGRLIADLNPIEVDTITRYYMFHMPEKFRVFQSTEVFKLPLYVALHGGGQSSKVFVDLIPNFYSTAERDGFIVVFPEGTCRFPAMHVLCTWNAGHCCGLSLDENIDDVFFLDTLVASLVENNGLWEYPVEIDPDNIHVLGGSNGGMMTYTWATNGTTKIKAIAPICATLGGRSGPAAGNFTYIPPEVPENFPAVVHSHGLLDNNVPINGGIGSEGTDGRYDNPMNYSINYWLHNNLCSPSQIDDDNIEIESDRAGNFLWYKYSQCPSNKKVYGIIMPNVAHNDMMDKFDATTSEGGFTKDAESFEDLLVMLMKEATKSDTDDTFHIEDTPASGKGITNQFLISLLSVLLIIIYCKL